jgi:hypothetical protein
VVLEVGIEEISGESTSERFELGGWCTREKVGVSEAALFGGGLKNLFNAGGWKRHGAAPFG